MSPHSSPLDGRALTTEPEHISCKKAGSKTDARCTEAHESWPEQHDPQQAT